jgi:hypothetical protein
MLGCNTRKGRVEPPPPTRGNAKGGSETLKQETLINGRGLSGEYGTVPLLTINFYWYKYSHHECLTFLTIYTIRTGPSSTGKPFVEMFY